MIIIRQKDYSKTSKMIKGALIVAPAGLVAGTVVGARRGEKKASEEEKKEAAKKRIEENKKQINKNDKDLPKWKEIARKERNDRGPEKDWDDLDRAEVEAYDEVWRGMELENKELKKENKELKSGNYESILADETPTGKKHMKRGGILGTAAGLGTGALLGYGLHKIVKR